MQNEKLKRHAVRRAVHETKKKETKSGGMEKGNTRLSGYLSLRH